MESQHAQAGALLPLGRESREADDKANQLSLLGLTENKPPRNRQRARTSDLGQMLAELF